MMRILAILLFIASLSMMSQTLGIAPETRNKIISAKGQDTLDKQVLLEVFYDHIDIDTVLTQVSEKNMCLQVGEKATFYQSYALYRTDSLFYTNNDQVTFGEANDLYGMYRRQTPYRVSRDRAQNILTEDNVLMLNRLRAADSTATFAWTMHEDTARICGYLCHRATANFRGRTWTAWWTEEIPIDAGPWKLHGLPGLILRASDSKRMHQMEATGVRKPLLPHIVRSRAGYRKVSRAFLAKETEECALNYEERVQSRGIIQREKRTNKRRFYSPYEDE